MINLLQELPIRLDLKQPRAPGPRVETSRNEQDDEAGEGRSTVGRGAVQPQQPVAMIDTTSDDDVGEMECISLPAWLFKIKT